jgi:3,4-dihydroxy 2-butanone 4-phosphate synthase / GTP cyclohydrolase II
VFGELSERSGLLSRSMEMIAAEGRGVLVLINKPMKGIVSRFMQLRAQGKAAGDPQVEELRDYGGGAQILAELGVHDMILLTNTHHSLVGLDGYGLSIVGERAIPGTGGE